LAERVCVCVRVAVCLRCAGAGGKAAGPAYTAKDLAGMKVHHGLEEFREGESVYLTMKDTRILDDKGELAEEDDELEVRCGAALC
jgi:hypothetical protein